MALVGGESVPTVDDAQLAAAAPYAYSYLPLAQDLLQQTAVMICAQLAGHNASHAPSYAGKRRTFALVIPDSDDFGGDVPGLSSVLSTLAGCGISNPPIIYTDHSNSGNGIQAQMAKLKQKGITSLIYLPHLPLGGQPTEPMGAANAVRYDPEWIIASTNPLTGANIAAEPQAETQSSFGVTSLNKLLPLSDTPWNEAFIAAGGTAGTASKLISGSPFYHELLLLASGVQMAGPDLTPQTFGAALTSTVFPNPGAGVGPSYQATVSFSSSNVMVRDFAGWWVNPSSSTASTLLEGLAQAGDDWQNYCWDELGAPHVDRSWPTSDHFRTGGTCLR